MKKNNHEKNNEKRVAVEIEIRLLFTHIIKEDKDNKKIGERGSSKTESTMKCIKLKLYN